MERQGRPVDWYDDRSARRLARELRRAGVKPGRAWASIERRARACSGWTNAGLDALKSALHIAWKCGSWGNLDSLDLAMNAAELDAEKFEGVTDHPRRAKLLALAMRLTRMRSGTWGGFGSERIARWLGVHRNTLDADVKKLADAGLLRVRKNERGEVAFSYKAGLARETCYSAPVVIVEGAEREEKGLVGDKVEAWAGTGRLFTGTGGGQCGAMERVAPTGSWARVADTGVGLVLSPGNRDGSDSTRFRRLLDYSEG